MRICKALEVPGEGSCLKRQELNCSRVGIFLPFFDGRMPMRPESGNLRWGCSCGTDQGASRNCQRMFTVNDCFTGEKFMTTHIKGEIILRNFGRITWVLDLVSMH